MSSGLIVGLVIGLVILAVVGALAVFVVSRPATSRPRLPGQRPARRAPAATAAGANSSPTVLPKTQRGLGAGSFVTPIGLDGTPLETTLLEVTQLADHPSFGLTIKFALCNPNSFSLLVAIPISHTAYLDCQLEREFDRDASPRLTSRSVLDGQRQQPMFGRNNDQQVLFGPAEVKEFVIQFDKAAQAFQTFDIEYLLEAETCPYGRYRLRYEFDGRRFTRRFLVAQPPRPW